MSFHTYGKESLKQVETLIENIKKYTTNVIGNRDKINDAFNLIKNLLYIKKPLNGGGKLAHLKGIPGFRVSYDKKKEEIKINKFNELKNKINILKGIYSNLSSITQYYNNFIKSITYFEYLDSQVENIYSLLKIYFEETSKEIQNKEIFSQAIENKQKSEREALSYGGKKQEHREWSYKRVGKREINGRIRVVYKRRGLKSEYIKIKGEYKKITHGGRRVGELERVNTIFFDKWGNYVDRNPNPLHFVNERGERLHRYYVLNNGDPARQDGSRLRDVPNIHR